jgi:translation initiation factor 1
VEPFFVPVLKAFIATIIKQAPKAQQECIIRMSDICSKCGLPQDICACRTLEKETTKQLRVFATKKRFNKLVTIVEGLTDDELFKVRKELKNKLAFGGTAKDGHIILQGDHLEKTFDYLVTLGYPREAIKNLGLQ